MKPIRFNRRALRTIRNFPVSVKREVGYQLDRVQRGRDPINWKPMPTIGKAVREIRIRDNGRFRVIYLAEFDTAVHVLHAFQKKSPKTRKQDIARAKLALRDALERRMK